MQAIRVLRVSFTTLFFSSYRSLVNQSTCVYSLSILCETLRMKSFPSTASWVFSDDRKLVEEGTIQGWRDLI